MKHFFTFILVVFGGTILCAQTYAPFNVTASIDIGNLNVAHLVHGDMWWDPLLGVAHCEFPKGSGKNLGFVNGLWLSSYNAAHQPHASAQAYRDVGNDYWPGPIDTSIHTRTGRYNLAQQWARIWKLNRSQVDSFVAFRNKAGYTIPPDIREWPAKGNPNAKGAGSVSLTITRDMAPFVDVNADGHYDVADGDYPLMKGDQMLWWIVNDYGPTHDQTGLSPLIVDIKVTAYAYKSGTSAANIIFYDYELNNQAVNPNDEFRFGWMCDFDLGNANDDYIGFDSSRRLGFVYNGYATDGTGGPGEYGVNPPAAGIAIMSMPGDSYKRYQAAGCFSEWVVSSTGLISDYYTLSRSVYAGGSSYRYNEDSECVQMHTPGDRRFVLASNSAVLYLGAKLKYAIALVAADSTGGCPSENFTRLRTVADTAYEVYWNPPPRPALGMQHPVAIAHLKLYPNPAASVLHIEHSFADNAIWSMNDALGRNIVLPQKRTSTGYEMNVATLPAGFYSIRLETESATEIGKFVKE